MELNGTYSWMGLTDPRGKIIAATTRESLGKDLSLLSSYRKARAITPKEWFQDQAVYMEEVSSSPFSGNIPVIRFCCPVYDEEGHFQGVFLAEIRLRFFAEQISYPQVSEDIMAYLVNREGLIIADIKGMGSYLDRSIVQTRAFQQAREGKAGLTKERYKGQSYLIAYLPLKSPSSYADLGWSFFVLQELNGIEALIWKQGIISASTVGLVGISIVLVGLWLGKRIGRPIITMAQVCKDIANGDLSQKVKVKTRDEIGILANAFNSMTEALKKNQEELLKRNQELSTLYTIATISSQSLDITRIMNDTLETLLRLMNLKGGWIFLRTEEKELCLLAHKGLSEDFVQEELSKPPDNCICLEVIERGKALVAQNMLECPRLNRRVIEEEGLRTHASIPLKAKGETIGVMNLAHSDFRQFSADELSLLTLVGQQIGLAIENARLFHSIERSYKELQETQTQIIQAAKMSAIGELAGGIAHEFNNLIAGIRGYAELAITRKDEKTVANALEVILNISDRAQDLVSKLMDFSHFTESALQRIKIESLINDTLMLIERELIEGNIRIVKDFEPLPPIMADPGKLQQAFLNILINARQAMPEGGTLTLTTRLRERETTDSTTISKTRRFVEIAFQDTGCGIPSENIDRIFEPFFTTKGALGGGNMPGTGLGLSLAYRYIKDHGGGIEVKSQVGKGSTFIITLPLEPEGGQA